MLHLSFCSRVNSFWSLAKLCWVVNMLHRNETQSGVSFTLLFNTRVKFHPGAKVVCKHKINNIWSEFHVLARDKANRFLNATYRGIILCSGIKLVNSYKNRCKVSFMRNSSTSQKHINESIFTLAFKHFVDFFLSNFILLYSATAVFIDWRNSININSVFAFLHLPLDLGLDLGPIISPMFIC